MKKHEALLRDPLAYVEHIGKHDRRATIQALAENGNDTVLRLCLSPNGAVPMRALGYAAAAQHIQARYFPRSQLQIIVPKHTIARVNNIPSDQTMHAAERFFKNVTKLVSPVATPGESLVYATDTSAPVSIDLEHLERITRDAPEMERLRRQSARRGGNKSELGYLAGHILMHDTVDALAPYGGHVLRRTRRIISIGAQSERPFYEVRMHCRQKGMAGLPLVESTGQIFTRHILPPYTPRRQPPDGTPRFDPIEIDSAVLEGTPIDSLLGHLDSVVRDIRHLREYVRAHGILLGE